MTHTEEKNNIKIETGVMLPPESCSHRKLEETRINSQPPQGAWSCQVLDFTLRKLISGFWPLEL